MNEIINNIPVKRIKNELLFFYMMSIGIKNRHYSKFNTPKNVLNDITLIDVSYPFNATFHLKLNKTKFTFVVFELSSKYPFKAPKVKIMNEDYKLLLNIDGFYLKKFKIKSECLHCSSFCCKNNWCNNNNLAEMMLEIHQNLNIKLRIMDHKMCAIVVEHFFGHYLPIDTFL